MHKKHAFITDKLIQAKTNLYVMKIKIHNVHIVKWPIQKRLVEVFKKRKSF